MFNHPLPPPIQIGQKVFAFSRPSVMGVLNLTPDSFFSESCVPRDTVLARAEAMVRSGADILDLGAESSRPGSERISDQEEIQRLGNTLQKLKRTFDIPLSLDTAKGAVAEFGLSEGVDMINNIAGTQMDPTLVQAVVKAQCPLVFMHMQNTPETMQAKPHYTDVISEVLSDLSKAVSVARQAGVSSLILDPGIGFGKTLTHNLSLLRHLDRFLSLGHPLLIGVSRKSFIGMLCDCPPEDRLPGSLGAGLYAVMKGVHFLRVHDVAETRQALTVFSAIHQS